MLRDGEILGFAAKQFLANPSASHFQSKTDVRYQLRNQLRHNTSVLFT